MTDVHFAVLAFSIFFGSSAFAQQENTVVLKVKDAPARSIANPTSQAQTIGTPVQKQLEESRQPSSAKPPAPAATKKLVTVQLPPAAGNLPGFARRSDVNTLEVQQSPIHIAKDIKPYSSIVLGRGDIVSARITQDLIGYEGAESPVRAIITEGPYKDAWLIGNATLDKKTKNILIRFSTFRSQFSEVRLEGSVHSVSGALGLKGEFNSNHWNYFWAEMLASGVSGYANALTERRRSVLGYSEIVPNPGSAANQAVAEAAAKTSDRLAERARDAPEFTVVRGPTEVQVFITKGPRDL